MATKRFPLGRGRGGLPLGLPPTAAASTSRTLTTRLQMNSLQANMSPPGVTAKKHRPPHGERSRMRRPAGGALAKLSAASFRPVSW